MTRKAWRRYMARYRAKALGVRCSRCSRKGVVQGTRCYLCRAADAERKHLEMEHATGLHASLLERSQKLGARCEASGLPLETLLAAGMCLQVDRIDNDRGYGPGNMQIVASYLNRLKSSGRAWPAWAVEELHERCARATDPTFVAEPY